MKFSDKIAPPQDFSLPIASAGLTATKAIQGQPPACLVDIATSFSKMSPAWPQSKAAMKINCFQSLFCLCQNNIQSSLT